MAKGVEDTAFYRYHRLVSTNEVGGDPGRFGDAGRELPPLVPGDGGRALAAHDAHRCRPTTPSASADVRARINVLSELPERLGRGHDPVARPRPPPPPGRTARSRRRVPAVPDARRGLADRPRTAGGLPGEGDQGGQGSTPRGSPPMPTTTRRSHAFARGVLGDHELVDDVERFLGEHRLVERGRVNALAQTPLLLTCPGVPDIYQGTEVWDLSLVDPDNRRPVDYAWRRRPARAPWRRWDRRHLGRSTTAGRSCGSSTACSTTAGAIRSCTGRPVYNPVEVEGPRREHVVAFTRGDELVDVVPRLVVGSRRRLGRHVGRCCRPAVGSTF